MMVLSPGTHSITVTYSGDTNYVAVSSPPVQLNIAKAPSVTTLGGVCAVLLPGQCTIVANVTDPQAPAGGPVHFMTMGASGLVDGDPSGTVQFFNGATSIGTAPLTSSTSLNVTSTASLSATVGSTSAVYSGDANFLGSTSTPTPKLATGVGLTASPNPSAAGQSVTLTATVVPVVPNPAIVAPTGTVTFLDGGTQLRQVALTAGMASLTASFSTAGPHVLSATYSGDNVYLSSSSAGYGQIVTPQTGTLGVLNLTPDTPSGSFGQQLLFTVTPTGTLTAPVFGSVWLLDGATVAGSASMIRGFAELIPYLPVGTHQLSAVWTGDGDFPPAVSPVLTYIVTRAPTTITLGTPTAGSALTATVTAYPAGVGTPTGTVQFVDGISQAVLATSTLIGGSATAMVRLGNFASQFDFIVAVYSGDANFSPSTTAPSSLAMVIMSGVPASLAAPDEIVTIYGANLATYSAAATPPLPTSLGGASVTVTDIAGVSRPAPLYYASPGQINLVIPSGSASGPATLTVAGKSLAISLTPVSPNLFPAGQIVAVHPDGTQSIASTDTPIAFGSNSLYLVLYATGVRNSSALGGVTCTIGNNFILPVTYAGAQSQYPGLDQVVVPLPASLQGVGTVRVVVDGSNALSLTFQ
jgi:uncharacterized protein (TIGR03437 family)